MEIVKGLYALDLIFCPTQLDCCCLRELVHAGKMLREGLVVFQVH